ncbi:MAG: regulatory protein RecX [Pseudonocardiaceae bacterium]
MRTTRTEEPRAANRGHGPGAHGSGTEAIPDRSVISPAAEAQRICLQLLTARPRSRAELADALRQRGILDEVGEPVLDRLGELGLVNDAALAEAAVYSGYRHRGLSRRALSTELRRRGVSEQVVGEAISAVAPEDEEAQARELVRRRVGTNTVRDNRLARKLRAMLARKGYSEGLAWRVVRDEIGPDACPAETEPCPD